MNLHEIPVGVPVGVANVAPVDVSDFRGLGISMRRGSRFVDACHVHARALHSCGAGLKGRHVMPFSQSLCRISVKERERERNFRPLPAPLPLLDLFCKAPALIEPSKAKRRIETSTKDNRRRAGIKVFEKLMKRRRGESTSSILDGCSFVAPFEKHGWVVQRRKRERCNCKGGCCIFSFLGKIRIREDIVVECKGLKKFGVGIFNEGIINLFFVLASNFCFR